MSNRDAGGDPPDSNAKPRLTVGMLFRGVSVLALVLGWLTLIHRSRPETVFVVLVVIGTLLSDVVGLRRLGPLRARLKAVTSFAVGSGVVAFYSAMLAAYLQSGPKDLLGLLAATFPFFAITLVLLLRSWTWAAHDQAARQRKG